MKSRTISPEQHYALVVEALVDEPAVTIGPEKKKGFGSSALCVNDKIFAMLSSGERFVVKLPRARVDALVEAGTGERFDPGHGRLMKEWLALYEDSKEDWLALAREAMAFVGSKK